MVFVPAMFGSGGWELVGISTRQNWSGGNNFNDVGYPAGTVEGDFAVMVCVTFGSEYGDPVSGFANDAGWSTPTLIAKDAYNQRGFVTSKILTSGDFSSLPYINGSSSGPWCMFVFRGGPNRLASTRHTLSQNYQGFTPKTVTASGLTKSATSQLLVAYKQGGRVGPSNNVRPSPNPGWIELTNPIENTSFFLLDAGLYPNGGSFTFIDFWDGYGFCEVFVQEIDTQ